MSNADSGVPLEEVLEYVERALAGDRRLRGQLFAQFQQLANHPGAPPEERALGAVLAHILLGNMNPDLSNLPDEAAEEITAFLDRRDRSANSGSDA